MVNSFRKGVSFCGLAVLNITGLIPELKNLDNTEIEIINNNN